jgi:hypothetical protein
MPEDTGEIINGLPKPDIKKENQVVSPNDFFKDKGFNRLAKMLGVPYVEPEGNPTLQEFSFGNDHYIEGSLDDKGSWNVRVGLTAQRSLPEEKRYYFSLGDKAVVIQKDGKKVYFVDPAPAPEPETDEDYQYNPYPDGFPARAIEFSPDGIAEGRYNISSLVQHSDGKKPEYELLKSLRAAAIESRRIAFPEEGTQPEQDSVTTAA